MQHDQQAPNPGAGADPVLPDPAAMLRDLLADRMTTAAIGARIGTSGPSVSRMAAKKQGVNYYVGKRIELLYAARFSSGKNGIGG